MGPRVAAIVESCWHRVPGGTATSTVRSLRAVADHTRWDVTGLSAAHRRPPVLDELDGIDVRRVPLPRTALYETWHRLRFPGVRPWAGRVDLVHATGGVVPPARRVPLVVTVHDLAFLSRPEHFTPRGVSFMTRALELARRDAALVVVPSTATADECARYGIDVERLRVVRWGADPTPVDDEARAEVRSRFALPERFALWVGTAEPRKNLARLLEAHRTTAPDLPLVLAGPDGWGLDLPPLLAGAASSVRHIGRVAADDLPVLYDLAAALVYPSLLEGFGMPVLEAMAQGTPPITGAGTATEEVAGPVGALVDPFDVAQIGAALASVADDPDWWEAERARASARAATMTWASTGTALAAVYDEVVG